MKTSYIIYLLTFFVSLSSSAAAQDDSTAFNYHKPLFDFDEEKPVFQLENEQKTNEHGFLRYSVLTGYREGVKPISGPVGVNFKVHTDPETGTKRFVMFNSSIAEMVTTGMVRPSSIYLEVKDPSKYLYDPKYGDKETWMRKNAYCYEFAIPSGTVTGYPLNKDLAQVFGIKFGEEKRTVKVLVLKRTSGIDKIKSKGEGEGFYNIQGHFNNIPLNRLAHYLADAGLPPMVDETNYKYPIDLDLKITSWKDLNSINKELKRYDLNLSEGMREMDMFVIKENK